MVGGGASEGVWSCVRLWGNRFATVMVMVGGSVGFEDSARATCCDDIVVMGPVGVVGITRRDSEDGVDMVKMTMVFDSGGREIDVLVVKGTGIAVMIAEGIDVVGNSE